MNKIYIILPVHNRRDITLNFVSCLKAQTYQNYQLILIDDGSTDGTEEAVRNELLSVVVIKGKGNWWWAGGLQQGINWLKINSSVQADDVVLMINDDVTFDSLFLETAISKLKNYQKTLLHAEAFSKQTGLLGCGGVNANFKNLTFDLTTSPCEINCLATMGLFMRFSDILKVGDFYPKLIPHYLSDYEFTIRAHNKGFNLITHPELKLFFNEVTTGFRYKNYKQLKLKNIIKTHFSKKSADNPIYWTFFIIICSPKKWIILNLLRIWKRTIILLTQKLIESTHTN